METNNDLIFEYNKGKYYVTYDYKGKEHNLHVSKEEFYHMLIKAIEDNKSQVYIKKVTTNT